MSRLGLHVTTGSRNGYSDVVTQRPAIVVSTEGGALLEAKQKSGGHAITVYRDMSLYNDNPGGDLNVPGLPAERAYAMAEGVYPHFRERWRLNPADYYIVINESGANDTSVIPNYVNYEWRMMELAEADGFRLCLCNLFSGTPDDGSVTGGTPNGGMETWKMLYGPLLRRAAAGGHIYGRHVYGFPDLVPLDANSDRAFREARWLFEQGIYIGVAITECGLDGGQGPVSTERLIGQAATFDQAIGVALRSMIVGYAWWTYGNFTGAGGQANIQGHSPTIASYLAGHPSEPWKPLDLTPKPPSREPNRVKHTIHLLPQDTTPHEEALVTSYLHASRSAFTFSHDVVDAVMYHSTSDGEIVAWDAHRWNFDVDAYFSWLNVRLTHRSFSDLEEPEPPAKPITYEVWPAKYEPAVTQLWAANPDNYKGFCDSAGLCLPGHDGVDIRAPEGTPIRAVAPGRVIRAHANPDDHNYGIHVYIEHQNSEMTGYCHLSKAYVKLYEDVVAGQVIGLAGNTGRSFGAHLHFVRKTLDKTYVDVHGKWPWNLADPTEFLKEVAPEAFGPAVPPVPPVPPVKKYDIYAAMATNSNGPLYEVLTQYVDTSSPTGWRPGPQERHQTHVGSDGVFYHTKGGDGKHKPAQWEELMAGSSHIYRARDTSPGDGKLYELQDVIGKKWSAWCPRVMAIGEKFYRNPQVIYKNKSTCDTVSSGRQESNIVLEAVYEEYKFFTGIRLKNVVQLAWLNMAGQVIERYFYANGYGLVGWGYGTTGRRAAISEIHAPGSRDPNIREEIACK